MKCVSCGKDNEQEEKFCIDCGMPLGESMESPKVEPPAQPPEVELPSQPPEVEASAVNDSGVPVGIRCPNAGCGKMNPPGTPFCVECGADLSQAPSSPLAESAVAAPPVIRARLILPDNTEIALTEATRMIGRSDFERAVSADDLKYISREHHWISFEADKFYIEDRDSANGTKLNGVEIKGMEKQELKDGDKLELAEVTTVTFQMA